MHEVSKCWTEDQKPSHRVSVLANDTLWDMDMGRGSVGGVG